MAKYLAIVIRKRRFTVLFCFFFENKHHYLYLEAYFSVDPLSNFNDCIRCIVIIYISIKKKLHVLKFKLQENWR